MGGVLSFFKIARVVAALLLLATIAVVASSCGGGALKNVRGLLTDVRARSIAEVETLTLQEQGTGKIWTFQAEEGDIGFTPSHLRVHMLQGVPVTVHYKEHDGTPIAVMVTD